MDISNHDADFLKTQYLKNVFKANGSDLGFFRENIYGTHPPLTTISGWLEYSYLAYAKRM